MQPLMPCTRLDFGGALFNFRIFSSWGPLLVWGPGQVAPLPPLSAALTILYLIVHRSNSMYFSVIHSTALFSVSHCIRHCTSRYLTLFHSTALNVAVYFRSLLYLTVPSCTPPYHIVSHCTSLYLLFQAYANRP